MSFVITFFNPSNSNVYRVYCTGKLVPHDCLAGELLGSYGHEMVVVDDLNEWLDFRALGLSGFRHAAGDLGRVAFDTGDEGVRERVRFRTGVKRLDYHDLVEK